MRNGDRTDQERDRDAQRQGRREQSGRRNGEHPVPDHASGGRRHGGGPGPKHWGLSELGAMSAVMSKWNHI